MKKIKSYTSIWAVEKVIYAINESQPENLQHSFFECSVFGLRFRSPSSCFLYRKFAYLFSKILSLNLLRKSL